VTSAFAPLRRPVFRMLWATWVTANTCMWMNDVAAAWMMTSLSASPALVALVQTASTLPVFLLGLPSGALADILDRRRWFMATQIWVAIVGLVLAAVVLAGAMTPALLLALTFANGMGLAMRWPVFAAIVPELVPRDELPTALGLNSIAMNASRIIGPVLAGALIAGAGSAYVFALNAALSMTSALVIWRWKRDAAPVSALPGERFVGAMRVGIQYVRQSPRMRAVLVRAFIFFLQSNALLALLPLIAQRVQGGGAGTFTLMLASMGAGAIAAALMLPRLRGSKQAREPLVRWGVLVLALSMAVVALVPNSWIALPAMLIGGAAWITVANTLTMSAQLALPDWVRARGMSIYQMALMGGAASGAALWGQVASWTDVRYGVLAAAVVGVLATLLASRRFGIEGGAEDDVTPVHPWQPPQPHGDLDPSAGPVLVTIEYRIDPARADDSRAVMQESRRARMRLGALSWELLADVHDPRRFVEYFVDESWAEHVRRFDRFTAGDVALRERRMSFHVGEEPPQVSRFVPGLG
jgi:MFS family permease